MRDSRLTTLAAPPEGGAGHVGPLRFRRLGERVLLTNDAGRHALLPRAEFESFLSGKLDPESASGRELAEGGFYRERLDFEALAKSYRTLHRPLFGAGPSLHMLVATLRCNQKCHYCHSSAVSPSRTDTDMDVETARKAVDFIFSTPNPTLCIEFQGGEPLLNWPVVRFVVEYARLRNQTANRRLIIALVSNFTLLTDERLDFLLDRGVSLCTSLDGPADLHDKNRPFLGSGEAQEKVVERLRRVQQRCAERPDKRYYLPGALMTTTRFSLDRGPEIVDLYASLDMPQIFLRPLSPIGYAKRVWGDIGYTSEQWLAFYDKTLDYILDLNRKGTFLAERLALILLTKILSRQDPGYMDLRSPAGAALGALAYNYDGRIFVSDEGRMVDHQGDAVFQVGDVRTSRWTDVLDHPTTRACVAASTLESQPLCGQCAYQPYCGVEPVFHYETQHNVWGRLSDSDWCRWHMGVFDLIFKKLESSANREVFERWLERDRCQWEEGGQGAADEARAGT